MSYIQCQRCGHVFADLKEAQKAIARQAGCCERPKPEVFRHLACTAKPAMRKRCLFNGRKTVVGFSREGKNKYGKTDHCFKPDDHECNQAVMPEP